MKKPQELHDELTKKLVTENYVDLKPINKIEASPKSNWEAKYLEFINEAGSPALNPIVNNDKKINTAEGDEKIKCISAASILAKVYRDKIMIKMSKKYKNYSWNKNFGYGTKQHILGLKKYGLTTMHRKNFKPIHKMLLK